LALFIANYLPQAFDPDQSRTQNPYNPHRFKPQFSAVRNNSTHLSMRHFCAKENGSLFAQTRQAFHHHTGNIAKVQPERGTKCRSSPISAAVELESS
jgi:hypothetical protein